MRNTPDTKTVLGEHLLDLTSVRDRAKRKLERDFGPDLLAALRDPRTIELLLNADGRVWLERLGEPMVEIGTMRPSQANAILETIAGYHGRELTRTNPILECELPLDNSRFAGQVPPVVQGPCFAIRKKAVAVYTLDQYLHSGIITAEQHRQLTKAVECHRNILISGGTGSGKTTLINALVHKMVEVAPDERIVIIEDTGELQCVAENAVQYHTTTEVSMTRLLSTTLRMRPDRILVGEVRGPEARDLLLAWNTGHEGGAATIHSNSARAALNKLAMLVSMHPEAPRHIEPLIAEAVHVVVQISRTPGRSRRITELLHVHGYSDGQYHTEAISTT